MNKQLDGLFDDLSSYMAGTASVLFGRLQLVQHPHNRAHASTGQQTPAGFAGVLLQSAGAHRGPPVQRVGPADCLQAPCPG